MLSQYPLPFAETPTFAQADFIEAPSNEQARKFLAQPEIWTNNRLILWGPAGCGKTHLAHLWAAQIGARLIQAATLTGLHQPTAPLVIDNADKIADEPALFHILNAAAAVPVLLTTHNPPSRTTYHLPDLASRLRASQTVEIAPPDDILLATLLTRLASARQLTLPPQIQTFLLTRLPRTPAALREAIDRLDHASLATKQKITRPLTATLLADML